MLEMYRWLIAVVWEFMEVSSRFQNHSILSFPCALTLCPTSPCWIIILILKTQRLNETNIFGFCYNFCWRWEGCQNAQSLIWCSLSSVPMSYLTSLLGLIILWQMMSLSSVSCQFQKQIFPEGVRSVRRTYCPCNPLSCRHFILRLPAICREQFMHISSCCSSLYVGGTVMSLKHNKILQRGSQDGLV